MRITSEESLRAGRIEPIQPAPSGTAPAPAAKTPAGTPAAQVELSAQAQALAAAKAEAAQYLPAVQAAPETRDGLVSKLKTQVESGSYHVSGSDIAEQIIRRAAGDKLK